METESAQSGKKHKETEDGADGDLLFYNQIHIPNVNIKAFVSSLNFSF